MDQTTPAPPAPGQRLVTTWFLEMRRRSALRAVTPPRPRPKVLRVGHPSPAFSRFLYTWVGGPWHWRDRLSWTWNRWQAYLERPDVQTWVLYVDGMPAGYAELERQPGEQVEIAYFGLAQPFLGRGLGGYLLSVAIRKAWAMGARRLWVHTCSLDHPAALANYQARGFTVYDTRTAWQAVASAPPRAWPGDAA